MRCRERTLAGLYWHTSTTPQPAVWPAQIWVSLDVSHLRKQAQVPVDIDLSESGACALYRAVLQLIGCVRSTHEFRLVSGTTNVTFESAEPASALICDGQRLVLAGRLLGGADRSSDANAPAPAPAQSPTASSSTSSPLDAGASYVPVAGTPGGTLRASASSADGADVLATGAHPAVAAVATPGADQLATAPAATASIAADLTFASIEVPPPAPLPPTRAQSQAGARTAAPEAAVSSGSRAPDTPHPSSVRRAGSAEAHRPSSSTTVSLRDVPVATLAMLFLAEIEAASGPLRRSTRGMATSVQKLMWFLHGERATTMDLQLEDAAELLVDQLECDRDQMRTSFDDLLARGDNVPPGYTSEGFARRTAEMITLLLTHGGGFAARVETFAAKEREGW